MNSISCINDGILKRAGILKVRLELGKVCVCMCGRVGVSVLREGMTTNQDNNENIATTLDGRSVPDTRVFRFLALFIVTIIGEVMRDARF